MLDRRTRAARRQLSLALCLALAAAIGPGAPARAADPELIAGPGAGPDRPPAGAALLDEVFPDGLPFPFEAVLDRLRALAGPDNVQTALIPLGRSLQRYAASPDFFASPRLVVAVTGDTAPGPAAPRLADRLFLGYQPAAGVIEAISYNAAAGRFEFQEVVGYDGAGVARAEPAERRVCLACHQGQGPIFPRPLWTETNASPEVAARLAPLGARYHGAPVRQSVDALEAFDAATDRAARVPLSDHLWAEACPDAPCRVALLMAAIRTSLGALTPPPPPDFDARTAALWPEGLGAVSQDLPNRDPLLDWAEGGTDLETSGRFDPETPRPPLTLWQPGPDGFAAAARAIAAQLTPGDLGWIDQILRQTRGPGDTRTLPCTSTVAALPGGGSETRFACEARGSRLAGFRGPDGAGRIETLALDGQPSAPAFALPAGLARARTADGRRIEVLQIEDAAVHLRLVDDLAVLGSGLAAATTAPALAPGPFPRPEVLGLIGAILGVSNG